MKSKIQSIDAFCESFPEPEFFCYREAVINAGRDRFQFDIIHVESGLKIVSSLPTKATSINDPRHG